MSHAQTLFAVFTHDLRLFSAYRGLDRDGHSHLFTLDADMQTSV